MNWSSISFSPLEELALHREMLHLRYEQTIIHSDGKSGTKKCLFKPQHLKCRQSLSVCVVGHQGGDRTRGSGYGSGHADGIAERYTSGHVVQVNTP